MTNKKPTACARAFLIALCLLFVADASATPPVRPRPSDLDVQLKVVFRGQEQRGQERHSYIVLRVEKSQGTKASWAAPGTFLVFNLDCDTRPPRNAGTPRDTCDAVHSWEPFDNMGVEGVSLYADKDSLGRVMFMPGYPSAVYGQFWQGHALPLLSGLPVPPPTAREIETNTTLFGWLRGLFFVTTHAPR